MRRKKAKPPAYLELSGRKLWKAICEQFEFNPAELQVLETGLACLQRRNQARALLDHEGLVIKSDSGTCHAHPAASIEKQAHAGWIAAFRALGLREDQIEFRPGRPVGRKKVEHAD